MQNNSANIYHIPLERVAIVGRIKDDILYGIYKNNRKVYILTNIVVVNDTVVGFIEGVALFCSLEDFGNKTIDELKEFTYDFYFSKNS